MKQLPLLLLCAGMTATATAQKNSVLVSGNFSANSNTVDDGGNLKQQSNSFGINPAIGYQFSDHWTVGVEGAFNFSSMRSKPRSIYYPEQHRFMGGGGLFARYTLPITNNIFLYGQGDAMYTRANFSYAGMPEPNPGSSSLTMKLTPAIGFNIKNGYALNLQLGSIYADRTTQHGSPVVTTNIGTTFGQSFSIGVSKNFIRHKRSENKADAAK